jgi:hypothetical protein
LRPKPVPKFLNGIENILVDKKARDSRGGNYERLIQYVDCGSDAVRLYQ